MAIYGMSSGRARTAQEGSVPRGHRNGRRGSPSESEGSPLETRPSHLAEQRGGDFVGPGSDPEPKLSVTLPSRPSLNLAPRMSWKTQPDGL